MSIAGAQPLILPERDYGAAPARRASESSSSAHLVPLFGSEWALWSWFCVRGAGFPSHLPQQLADSQLAALGDELLGAELENENARERLLAAIRQHLDENGPGDDRKRLGTAITQLNKGKVPDELEPRFEELGRKLLHAKTHSKAVRDLYARQFAASIAEISMRVREIAARPEFQEAVLLQNRAALHQGIDILLQRDSGATKNKKHRQQEELVANYLQRYCLKNDSIGFFGPIGWCGFLPELESIRMSPPAKLVEKRTTYFETWCLDALGEKLCEDPAIRAWIPPRRSPLCHLEGNQLLLPGGGTVLLSHPHAALLRRCDGRRTAKRIALELTAMRDSGFQDESELYAVLDHYVQRGALVWKAEVPMELHPEIRLRRQLERIEEPQVSEGALGALDQLEAARDRVNQASGNFAQLDAALGELDAVFVKLTGKSSTRSSGKIYAARTLIYQDCRRDLDLEIGRKVIARLGAPLSLLLKSARWFTFESALLYRREFERLHAKLSSKKGPAVGLIDFWIQAQDMIVDHEQRLYNQLIPELDSRWSRILRLPDASRVQFSSDELKPQIDAVFPAPRPGWKLAKYHSPDIMIAAPSVEAIHSGDFSLVLGEIHIAVNTLRSSFAFAQHPRPEDLYQAFKADQPRPHVVPVASKSWPDLTNRTTITLVSDHDYYLESAHDAVSPRPESRTLPISALILEHSTDGLIARTRDGRLSFDAVEVFGELLSLQAIDCLHIVPRLPHVPRITIDDLIVQRESWTFAAADLVFATESDDSKRFLAARRWMRQRHLPRYVFVKVPCEPKPFYVDFDSPLYVDIFSKMVRRVISSPETSRNLTVSEMLPGPDQLWLLHPSGHKCTCEFRIVVVDQSESDNELSIKGDQR